VDPPVVHNHHRHFPKSPASVPDSDTRGRQLDIIVQIPVQFAAPANDGPPVLALLE